MSPIRPVSSTNTRSSVTGPFRFTVLARLVIGFVLVVGVVACSGDDDSRTVETDDGEITVSGDGDGSSGVITGPDGEETTFSAGADAEMPDGWPDDITLPEGAELTTGSSSDDGRTLNATAVAEGEVLDVYDHFKGVVEAGGYELITDTVQDLGEETMVSLQAEKDDRTVMVVLTSAADRDGHTSISAVVETQE